LDRGYAITGAVYHVDLPTNGLAPGAYTLRVHFNSPSLAGELDLPVTLN
jgi:hypothetical protein